MRIVSIGEVLWDVFGTVEKLGGAPFNFAVQASRLGHQVTFVSAVGDDERGRAALSRAEESGLDTSFIQVVDGAATGAVSVRVDSSGQPDFTIHRPAAYDSLHLGEAELARLAALQPEWLYYGTLYQALPQGRAEARKLIERLTETRRFYDVNLRRDSFTSELVQDLMSGSHVVKLNDDEVNVVGGALSVSEFLAWGTREFGWQAAAVTRGAQGCVVQLGGELAQVPGFPVKVVDTVGAGDAFAAAFLHGLGEGWSARKIGEFANRLGAEVAGRAGAV